MATQSFPALQAHDGFPITPDDTQTVDQHAGNTEGYKHCFVHNKGVGAIVKVTTAQGNDLDVYINQGATCELAVIRVFSTGTAAGATDLVGFVGKA
jgi:hypothetical protein